MSYSSDFTITTLSESVGQREFQVGVEASQAPFKFGGNYAAQTLRLRADPYILSDFSDPPNTEDQSLIPIIPPQNVDIPLIDNGATVRIPSVEYIPTLYTEIVSASNENNTTAMHVGSLYIEAATYAEFGALITDIGSGGSDVHVEFIRFTGGTSLLTMTNSSSAGPTWRAVSASNVTVSNSDWYDIYISSSDNPATSSIRGVYYQI